MLINKIRFTISSLHQLIPFTIVPMYITLLIPLYSQPTLIVTHNYTSRQCCHHITILVILLLITELVHHHLKTHLIKVLHLTTRTIRYNSVTSLRIVVLPLTFII